MKTAGILQSQIMGSWDPSIQDHETAVTWIQQCAVLTARHGDCLKVTQVHLTTINEERFVKRLLMSTLLEDSVAIDKHIRITLWQTETQTLEDT